MGSDIVTYLLTGDLEEMVDELGVAVLELDVVGLRDLGGEVLGRLNLR